MELMTEKTWISISIHTKSGKVMVDGDFEKNDACDFCREKDKCDKKGLKPCVVFCG